MRIDRAASSIEDFYPRNIFLLPSHVENVAGMTVHRPFFTVCGSNREVCVKGILDVCSPTYSDISVLADP